MELKNDFRVRVPADEAWAVLTDIERIAPCMPGAELYEIEDDEYHGSVKVKVGPITAQYRGKAFFLEKDEAAHRAVLRAEGRDNRGQGNANATITAQLIGDGDGTRVEVTTDLSITGKVAQFGRGVLADVSVKLLDQFVQCLETDLLAGVSVAAEPVAADPVAAAAEPETVELDADVVELEPVAAAAPALDLVAEEAQPEPVGGPADEPEPKPVLALVAEEVQEPEPEAAKEAVAITAGPGSRKIESKPAAPVDLLGTAGAPLAKRVLPVVAAAVVVVLVVRRWRRR